MSATEKSGASSVFYRDPVAAYPVGVSAKGVYVFDSSGRRYLDMSGGAAVSAVGHGNAEVIAAIRDQVEQLAYAHTAFFTNEPQEQLASRLTNRFGEPGARVYFSSGGSEANETALKLAWQYWQAKGQPEKTIVISRQQSYHGSTLGALSVSGNVGRRTPYEAVLHNWPRVAPCYRYRHKNADETDLEYGKRAAADLERAIEQAGPENVAAFIAEPVVGATLGVVPAVEGYFAEVRRICDQHNVLLIADEIMCGSGRTGDYFAHAAEGIIPDIVTMAKGLGGGYQPLGATLAKREIAETVGSGGGFVHGHTYIGHATACAAGVAVQNCLDNGLLAGVAGKGSVLMSVLSGRFGDRPYVGNIRGRGLFAGIEFVVDRDTKEPFPIRDQIAKKLKAAAMREGLICYPGSGSVDGRRGAHLLLAPPYIVEKDHLEEMADKLDVVFKVVFEDNGRGA